MFQGYSWVKAGFRRLVRGVIGTKPDQSGSGAGDEPGLARYQRYHQQFARIPGWFAPEAAALWDCLLTFQDRKNIFGHLLEIGVWKGKSAACLALHARPDEMCVLVDQMILPEMQDTLGTIRKNNNLFAQMPSSELRMQTAASQLKSRYRWIHIDGEHSGQAVWHDLALAHEWLSDQGIICVDDFSSAAYPQLTFAVVEYLAKHSDLVMFAMGLNKGYICRRPAAMTYLNFFRDELLHQMTLRNASVTIWKTGRPEDGDCFGITRRRKKLDFRGPDWDPGSIRIFGQSTGLGEPE